MAGAKDLNVRVGFIFDEKSLNAMERRLQRSGERLSRIGSDLSLSFTAPLALLGGGAIKAAGDMESLTLALQSQLGSAEAARKEFELLNQAAKSPGLGVEQAVQGSVRLQGVGASAEEARQVLIQMGNAIARTGGTAQNLDAVTKQFSQMISKGRVLQEDVSILSENMPAIAGLMKQAFGTTNVEAIRAMGVSGKDFVLQITKAAETLPRVSGGIKNSLGNTIDSIKQSLASFGTTLNNTFDIAGGFESLAATAQQAVKWFGDLDPAVQKLALGLAGALAAAGPLAKTFGTFQLLGSQLVGIWGGIVGGLKGVSAWVSTTATAFNALNAATKAFVVIGIATAILSLANNMGLFNRELTAAEKAQQAVNDVNREAVRSIAEEKSSVDTLISVLNSEVASRGAKERALQKLKDISPEYFGQLKIENGIVNGLTASYEKYVAALLASARVEAAKAKLVEVERELLDLEDQRVAKLAEGTRVASAFGISAERSATREAEAYGKQIEAINAKRTALTSIVAQYEISNKTTDKSTAATIANTKAVTAHKATIDTKKAAVEAAKKADEEQTAELGRYAKMVGELEQAWLSEGIAEREARKASIDAIDTSGGPGDAPLVGIGANLANLPNAEQLNAKQATDAIDTLKSGAASFAETFQSVATMVSENGTVMQNVFFSMGQAIQDAAASGESSFASLASAAVGAAAKVVRAWIQQGVAAAVAKALGGLPFPFNLAAGAAAGGLAAALFTKGLNAIGVPKFAAGTNFATGGLSLVGERGPELVNLPRGSQVVNNSNTRALLNNMGGGQLMQGEFTVRGTDLVLVLERAQRKNARFR